MRLDGVALGLVGLRAEGHGSRHLAFSEAGGAEVLGFRAETPAQRDDTQDVNDFLTTSKGVSGWLPSLPRARFY